MCIWKLSEYIKQDMRLSGSYFYDMTLATVKKKIKRKIKMRKSIRRLQQKSRVRENGGLNLVARMDMKKGVEIIDIF